MVNNDKVALMTHLAIYENDYGRESDLLQRYHKRDYIRMNSLKTFFISTAAFILMIALYCCISADHFMVRLQDVDVKKVCIIAGLIYAVFIKINIWISNVVMGRRYEKARGRSYRYYRQMTELEKLYEDEQLASYVASKEKEMELNEPIISN